ncbi:MAG: RNA polymerase sigma factor [Sphingomonadales bacterium]|nr:RNA polymerase sigma factor [Sphingomonadales bacterium]
MRAFLVRLAGAQAADELAQETFLRAWLRAADYRGEGAYAGWLYRIGWRLHCDHARKSARRAALAPPGTATECATEPGALPALDAALDARRVLATLDDRTRAALILCDGHGVSHAEAAEILDLPLGTLKSLVHRARQRLRAAFGDGEPT